MQVRTTGAELGRRASCLICLFLEPYAVSWIVNSSSLLIGDKLRYCYCVAVMYDLFIAFFVIVMCNGLHN